MPNVKTNPRDLSIYENIIDLLVANVDINEPYKSLFKKHDILIGVCSVFLMPLSENEKLRFFALLKIAMGCQNEKH